jgi:hypothetical protein
LPKIPVHKPSDESLNWARDHVRRFGDNDLFPLPFEYECLWTQWATLRATIQELGLGDRQPRPPIIQAVPKGFDGFRVATQLDPIEAILYAAASFECAAAIEAWRPAVEDRTACSYRILIDDEGGLFRDGDGWAQFRDTSRALAEECGFVVVADIADCYNQISSHRIRNAISDSTQNDHLAHSIENYLMDGTARNSKGLPVGPSASMVFSEAALTDIDQYLSGKGLRHCRYVDDIRIFVASRGDAMRALHDLAHYLHTAHRLALQNEKTRIVESSTFIAEWIDDPENEEREQQRVAIDEFVEGIHLSTGYWIADEIGDISDIPDPYRATVIAQYLERLLEDAISGERLRLGLARFVLRRARVLRLRAIMPFVVQNLSLLSAAMRDVCLYLSIARAEDLEVHRAEILRFLYHEPEGSLPYVRMWWAWYFATKNHSVAYQELRQLPDCYALNPAIRWSALLARSFKDASWVRAHKESWHTYGPWDRRGLLWAGGVLPQDERRAWLGRIARTAEDPLDRCVAASAANGVPRDESAR